MNRSGSLYFVRTPAASSRAFSGEKRLSIPWWMMRIFSAGMPAFSCNSRAEKSETVSTASDCAA